MSEQTASIAFTQQDTQAELPMYEPTLGKPVVDVSGLGKSGVFTFDPGFMSTAACESKITYIDGENGVLLYRGYPIDQLADEADFLEVCYLLLNGELPSGEDKREFEKLIQNNMLVHEQIKSLLQGFARTAHPMAMLLAAVGGLAAISEEILDVNNPEHRKRAVVYLVAKMPTLVAMCHRYARGKAYLPPQSHLSYSENFMHMMFGSPSEPPSPNPVLARAMDKIFILHADHEQNASTSTVRLAGSTGANPLAAISAGIAALWGPAHGGANEAALNMLQEIGDVSRIGEYIKRAKDKDDPFRLMGFGHRVYKNFDPRSKVMRETCHQVLGEVGKENDPLFKLAMELERIALEDEYFVKRKLYPNVDFYSGITQSALGIPTNLFTAIFALARTIGWMSHWLEMYNMPGFRIGRPRQLYTGPDVRDYIPVEQRG